MAIVKAYFTRSSANIKKTLNYIVHRPGREGEKLTRELFGHTAEAIRKDDAYQFIEAGSGMTFFHLKINFHAKQEDTRKDLNLRDITRQTIAALEERLQRTIRFLAVEHNDHTPLRHVHAIILVKLGRGECIGIADWQACREKATEQAGLQRRALDAVRQVQKDIQRGKTYIPERMRLYSVSQRRGVQRGYRSHRILYLANPCPECDGLTKQSVKTLRNGAKWCPVHGVINRKQRLRIRQEQGLGL